ncbi:hypothetical protein VN12_07530 [Pirellula sp. SH-Sr6A]|uniref:hypothetical protein n=1 Tax=Pirellula sp. SH-Sr6A TaxID=1632865 RepID=UPI00078C6086|nr:hypothetical protein [Pirellula sp. SH-Sr6A]AMV31956.1 hypothetical protein VN12_07530 [Pirellula sp. SH-Sr6A]
MLTDNRFFSWITVVLLASLFLGIGPVFGIEGYGTPWPENHPDRILIEQISQAGLHEVAIEICQRRGNDSSLSSSVNEKAHWRMLWMEACTYQRISNSGTWLDNPSEITQFLEEIDREAELDRTGVRGPWVQFQSARCRWLLLRSAVSSYLASPTRTVLSEWALTEIRRALEILERIEQDAASIATASRPNPLHETPTATEVSSLIADSKLLRCDLLVLRASLYRDNGDEQSAAGTSMLALLEEAEKRIGVNWRDYPKIEIARCRAWLYLQQHSKVIEAVQSTLGDWDAKGDRQATERWRATLCAIASESLRRTGNLSGASEWLERGGGWQTDPSLAIEHFAIELARTQATDSQSLQRVLDLKRDISDRFGTYWSNRADALLIASNRAAPGVSNSPKMPGSPGPTNASVANELIKAEVRQLLAGKRWEQAIDRLQQAELASSEQKDIDSAMSFAMQIAALWGLQGDPMASANEFYRAAVTYADSPLAPKSAMNGVSMVQAGLVKLSQAAELTDVQRQEQREEWLRLRTEIWKELLERWPVSEQASTAADSLADFYLGTDQIDDWCELWVGRWEKLASGAGASSTSGNQLASREAIHVVALRSLEALRVYAWLLHESWLDSSIVNSEDGAKWDRWMSRTKDANAKDAAQDIAMEWDRLMRWRSSAGWEFADRLAELSDAPKWLVAWVPAHQLALQLSNASPSPSGNIEDWKELNRRVTSTRDALPTDSANDTALMRSVRRSTSYLQCVLEHYADPSGGGLQRLIEFERNHPRDPWWSYYSALILSGVPEKRASAELSWKRLAAAVPVGSVGWLECRARQVRLLRTSGRTEEANQLAELVLATTPGIDALWRGRFPSK